jgi:ABC-type multidrug transport system ATPase subunit
MATESAIQVVHLNKSFGAVQVLYDLSFSVDRGSIFGFLGPNGSGKSTTIKILCGLLEFNSGSASILGLDVKTQIDQVRHKIGYMSQQFGLYGDLTVLQNLKFYGGLYGIEGKQFAKRVDEIATLTKIGPYLNQKSRFLSGGWKQRLALGCAIIHEPPVIFLDEPTAGIDPVARRDLWDLLFDLSSQGITLFVTTHYMDEAERCNKVAYIYRGQLIAYGTNAELRHLPAVTPTGTRRLEIACEPIMTAYRLLSHQTGVLDVTIFGSNLHILASDTVSNEQLTTLLKTQHISVEHLVEIVPSLEDVFVSLTQNALAQSKQAGQSDGG